MNPEFSENAPELAALIDALLAGNDIATAASKAGIKRDLADRFLQSIKDTLPGNTGKNRPLPKIAPGSVVAYSDGASRGNPGRAACAVIVLDDKGEEVYRRAKLLGKATNNAAEYEGVILAAEIALALKIKRLELRMDSELVVKQLNGDYKVKNEALKPLFRKATSLLDALPQVTISHIPRAENKVADKLANAALDGKDLDGE